MTAFLPQRLGLAVLAALGLGAAAAEEFQVRSWHVEDGLPAGTITALAQTADGYLWVGTAKGLARFDGVQFKTFDSRQLPDGADAPIRALLADRQGALWVGCDSGRLLRFQRGQFEAVPLPPGQVPVKLAQDDVGAIWCALAGGGLLRLEDQPLRPAPMARFTNGLPGGPVEALCAEPGGPLWALADGVPFRWNGRHWQQGLDAPGSRFTLLSPARQGGIWTLSPHGVAGHDGGSVRRLQDGEWHEQFEATPFAPASLRSTVTTMLEDRSGRLWLGLTWNGLYQAEPAQPWQCVSNEGPLSQATLNCILEDAQGTVWVGTQDQGLYQVKRCLVTMLKLPPPAQENLVTTSCVGADGSLWIGTDGAGLFRYRDGQFTPFGPQQGLSSGHVCSLLEDHRTNLWAGTWNGLFAYRNGTFARVQGPPELGAMVLALFEDRTGTLWVGTAGGLIERVEGGWRVYRNLNLEIRSLADDSQHNLWIGTTGQGLFRLHAGRLEQLAVPEGLGLGAARCLYCDADDVLWTGGDQGGLHRFKDGHLSRYSSADGLPSDVFVSLLGDGKGNLWIASVNGIFSCAPSLLAGYERGRSPALFCPQLNLADGLGNRVCSGSGQPVISRLPDGRLGVPNMRGLALFDPAAVLAARPQSPGVFLESVTADGEGLVPSPDGEVRVSSDVRRFEFRYTAPDLVAPQALRFRHRLEGMDKEWVASGTQRAVSYSRLPPGAYRFRVMVGAADGQWHEAANALRLRVVPHLWEVRAVQVLAGMALVAVVGASLLLNERRRARRKLERVQMQHAVERERIRIAKDIHDDLGANLTQIALMSEVGKRAAGDAAPHFDRVADKARAVARTLDEIVWAVNPKNDNLPRTVSYLSRFGFDCFQASGIRCRQSVPADFPKWTVRAEVRHNLFLSAKEAFHNVLKHSQATEAWLRLRLEGPILHLEIEDNGRGFDPAKADFNRSGLQNMAARMHDIGGAVALDSQPGRGTRVCFTIALQPAPAGHDEFAS
jgi:ligand-binding sensor domain-containing protein/signal transduction histidine kinase